MRCKKVVNSNFFSFGFNTAWKRTASLLLSNASGNWLQGSFFIASFIFGKLVWYSKACNKVAELISANQGHGLVARAFALEGGRLGSILSRVKSKTLKLVSAVTLAKRSAIKCSAEDEMNR